MNRFVRTGVVISLLLASPRFVRADAESDEAARQHFAAGQSYFDRGRYADAAREFLEAYELSHRAQLLFNASVSLERELRLDEAAALMERYEQALPEGSDERVNASRQARRLRQMAERRRAEQEAAAPANETPAEQAAESETTEPVAEVHDDGGRGPAFSLGLTALGVGAGALITAAILDGRVRAIHDDLVASCTGGLCPIDLRGDAARGTAMQRGEWAMWILGGAAAATGITLTIVGRGDDDAADRPTATLRLGPGSLGITGRF